ncbi:MAG: hypothetical protein KA368_02550 [Acidobacteria bacterium]|nr:hypothetical protein [Acidobacteriota bacterium]
MARPTVCRGCDDLTGIYTAEAVAIIVPKRKWQKHCWNNGVAPVTGYLDGGCDSIRGKERDAGTQLVSGNFQVCGQKLLVLVFSFTGGSRDITNWLWKNLYLLAETLSARKSGQ